MDGSSWLILIVVMGVMMFFSHRRMKAMQQAAQDMFDALKPGDHVITTSGLHGIVEEINTETIVLDCEGVYLTFERRAISRIVNANVQQTLESGNLNEDNSETEVTQEQVAVEDIVTDLNDNE